MSNDLFITSSNIKSSAFYQSVKNDFVNAWKDTNKPHPTVHNIWYINQSTSYGQPRFQAYVNYEQQIRNQLGGGNVIQQLYRGVKRACNIGDSNGQLQLCNLWNCDLCHILKTSYVLRNSGGAANFGTGIYTSSHSSKSHDYAINVNNQSRYHVILLSHIVVGNTYKVYNPAPGTSSPPWGCHSLEYVPSYNGQMKHPETVVYRTDAALPSVMIVYST
ncbi:hypothetical protein SERLA73DRAFT_90999 [Serpula lacrymans var. lacrymans S7.3]|uniref:PARP catalytic domain-containing protein n=2 Tax=Serpula lacrymans var. lacrymans TaxID=341189 RepID=F8Q0N9_SERL3|nr:uncharacterized protein SERLADRAFT_415950 [Serpula lacrymans var. lacrymans S7.9]EGN97868.1 hypothetical protein SERLA73DRAFT_90999 [Serpula lacrymans var. lacrymans S7.3]EGO23451.1 hypothetical protein SERLADRAFT_415950 [Serpula lacrymans var. lacrymans S7.9]